LLAAAAALPACAPSEVGTRQKAQRSTKSEAKPAPVETALQERHVIGSPVSATLRLPSSAVPDAQIELEVELSIDPLWEIGELATTSGPAATRLQLELPVGIEVVGAWQTPTTIRSVAPDGHRVYIGHASFKQTLRVHAAALPGSHELHCKIQFQACNERQCLQPQAIELALPLEIRGR
jgi:hypothetical protein